ncbi:MAG: hypothetical protein AABX31_04745 [Nanoarchaeota archaeon]
MVTYDSEIPVYFEDALVDAPIAKRRMLPKPKKTALEVFRDTKVGLREGRHDHYTLDQLMNLQTDITKTYAKIYHQFNDGSELDPLLGSFLNDYITMWAKICDLKENRGYKPVNMYDNEPETKGGKK